MRRIVIPLPASDFDPTEAGVTWKMLHQNGVDVVFATPNAKAAAGDHRMLTGAGLGPWSCFLKANRNGLLAYDEMIASQAFQNPLHWHDIKSNDFDGIALAGGHAPGMRPYLESNTLQRIVAEFCTASRLVGAICHGVVLAARSTDASGRSVLAGRKVTALLRSQEMMAWAFTCLWLKNYYRTYPETVQAEVIRHLGHSKHFIAGPMPLRRDSLDDMGAGFIVEDENIITARWPGDAHVFGLRMAERLAR